MAINQTDSNFLLEQLSAMPSGTRSGKLRIYFGYAAGCVWLDAEEVHLTPIEYKLLCLLAKNIGKVLTHNFIMSEIWANYANEVPALRVFMATLRKKIESVPAQPKYIQTHIGVGYRMLRVGDDGKAL
jgi:two-component system KDP operon response regulator KdpE